MLLDRYGRAITYLRVSVTDRCNLRCQYCMPEEGTELFDKGDLLTYEELTEVISVAVELGITKFRITGGEPLVRRELPVWLGALRAAVPGIRSLAITTNGLLLAQHAVALRAAGIDKVNLSLDSFDRATFARLTRRDTLDKVLEGLAAAEQAGFPVIKLNAVLMRGWNDQELPAFLEVARERPLHVRFIEFMPNGEWTDPSLVVPVTEIIGFIESAGFLPDRGPDGHGPARYWRHPTGRGTVGVISPVTAKFCENCNRIRLNARGELRGCLLDESMVPLRDALRASGRDGIRTAFLRTLSMKPEKHFDVRTFHMSTIGG